MPHQKIRSLRMQLGLREADMAGALGMSRSAYSRLECGLTHMDMERLAAIAQVLGVPPWELVLPEERPLAADGLLEEIIRKMAGQLPEDVLLRLVRLQAARQAEARLMWERHARAARRIARLFDL